MYEVVATNWLYVAECGVGSDQLQRSRRLAAKLARGFYSYTGAGRARVRFVMLR